MVKEHAARITSLCQCVVKVVFAPGREEPGKTEKRCGSGISLIFAALLQVIIDYRLLSQVDVDLLSLIHDFVEALDEASEGLDLLHHVLVALQSLVILPGRREGQTAE